MKRCTDCIKLRTNECTRPDVCVSRGYCDFAKHRIGHKCPKCGARLKVQKTDPVQGTNVVYTYKVCSGCGKYAVKITFDATVWEK